MKLYIRVWIAILLKSIEAEAVPIREIDPFDFLTGRPTIVFPQSQIPFHGYPDNPYYMNILSPHMLTAVDMQRA